MSVDVLANYINERLAQGHCLVRENWDSALLSRLSADSVRECASLATLAALDFVILDEADHEIDIDEVSEDEELYRITLSKPKAENEGCLLTVRGLDFIATEKVVPRVVRVAGLSLPFTTLDTFFAPWEYLAREPIAAVSTKSPRNFVREYGDIRLVPQSIGRWILRDIQWQESSQVFRHWASLATYQCLLALGNEVQSSPASIMFKGPPRGTMLAPEVLQGVDKALFDAVQDCALWVYETPAETEMRHPLLSAEVARFSSVDGLLMALPTIFEPALDGARLAYELGISKLSSDTLKMLTDLRKSVFDEATKVSDSTRQLVASVATTLSVGAGLVAAKIGTKANGTIVGTIAVIASVYVIAIVWSGYRALSLQDEIRSQWKPRTYGFISGENYEELVDEPARKAAESYKTIARISLILTVFMFLVIAWSVAVF